MDLHDFRLFDFQIGRVFQPLFHLFMVARFICLCAQGIHSGPLAGIQHFRLDICLVNDLTHLAAQRIDFAYKVPL